MHADRFLEGNRVIEIPFLGKKACFQAGPFIVAAQFKTPVCFVFAMKESTTHYHFYSSEIRSYDFSDKNETIRKMLLEFAAGMEEKVRAYPEQWYNYYDFWAQAPSDRK
jgi:predicted LPLAT superfamily acyltransferase